MGILTAECDKCHRIIKADRMRFNYDGEIFCKKCSLENEFNDISEEFKNLKKWLKETHLKKLISLKKRANSLKKQIKGE